MVYSQDCLNSNPHLWQDTVYGVPALREHQVLVKHEVEGEGFAEGVGADPSLLCPVLFKAVQVLVESLLLRVLLLNQELDVVALLTLVLDNLKGGRWYTTHFF